jgi:hypothetical protein
MTRTAIFDEKFHAPIRWRDIAVLTLLKSTWDDYCKSHEHETKYEKEFEAEYQGLEAWSIGAIRGRRRACIVADAVIFWMIIPALVELASARVSNRDPLDLVERDLVAGAVVEFGGGGWSPATSDCRLAR